MQTEQLHKPKHFLASCKGAGKGILYSIQNERHLRFHLFAAFAVICCSFFLHVAKIEWLFIIYAIGSVLVAELFNTSVERVVDLAKPEYHPIAGIAKDVAAGAVMVTAIQAIVIGMIVFWPYVF